MAGKAHLMRSPLPWRVEQATECGMLAVKVRLVSPAEFAGLDKKTACSLCGGVLKSSGPDALLYQVQEAIGRGLASYRVLRRPTKNGTKEYRRRVNDPILFELQALADLAARHREEFEGLLAANESARTMQGGG